MDAPTPRLVVVNYAESRVEQLEVLLPALAGVATDVESVREVLLVRARTNAGGSGSAAAVLGTPDCCPSRALRRPRARRGRASDPCAGPSGGSVRRCLASVLSGSPYLA